MNWIGRGAMPAVMVSVISAGGAASARERGGRKCALLKAAPPRSLLSRVRELFHKQCLHLWDSQLHRKVFWLTRCALVPASARMSPHVPARSWWGLCSLFGVTAPV